MNPGPAPAAILNKISKTQLVISTSGERIVRRCFARRSAFFQKTSTMRSLLLSQWLK
jgi:hypothetical protein